MAMFQLHDVKGGEIISVDASSVVTLYSLLPATLQSLKGSLRLTVHNISLNDIEIGYVDYADVAPVTGAMDVLQPGDSITFGWQAARLRKLYVKAATATSKAYVWIEGK